MNVTLQDLFRVDRNDLDGVFPQGCDFYMMPGIINDVPTKYKECYDGVYWDFYGSSDIEFDMLKLVMAASLDHSYESLPPLFSRWDTLEVPDSLKEKSIGYLRGSLRMTDYDDLSIRVMPNTTNYYYYARERGSDRIALGMYGGSTIMALNRRGA
jgi:hypothetical protein